MLCVEDRGYELPQVTAEELETRIGWAKINDKAEVEEEVLSVEFVVPYPYVKAEEVAARPHLRRETLEATEVVGFGYESDGRESEAKEFGARSKADSMTDSEEGYQPAKSRGEKVQAKYEG